MTVYHCTVFWGVVAEGLVPCSKGGSCADAEVQVAGFVPIPLLSAIAFTSNLAMQWVVNRRVKA